MDADKKLESAAIAILTRAVSLDKANRYTESLVCYQEGITLLMDNWKGLPAGRKKDAMKEKIEEYMTRAEQIKKVISEKKESGTYHEEIVIENDSKGHSYESVMGRFLGSDVESVRIEDPYIRLHHQFCNLIQFCELVVKKCKNLKMIYVLTGKDSDKCQEQDVWFKTLKKDLNDNYSIKMEYEFSSTLHDRQIVLSNGWQIKIGRGLDYFKAPDVKHGLGAFDTDFRHCKETKVDIFHQKDTKKS
ncbi:UNVERIFIED_CONTAM: hypothetical protein PYX00_005586 [Menopon gallinae]|uniref:MIT domain-containing protein n=1 Tax=Menopon gallinae TaxID=328185 RepID=A0AAW2HS64_9NEOP